MDFAIIIQQMVDYFLKLYEIEMVFAGITFTLGNAVVWFAVAGIVIAFWNRLRSD